MKFEQPRAEEQPKVERKIPQEAIVDTDGSKWEQRAEEILQKYKHVIVLRGAGSNNGMDKAVAHKLMQEQLLPRIKSELATGPVAIMFDGDPDTPDKPDIGSVMGELRRELDKEQGVAFITAQKKSWYYPSQPGGNLGNAEGLPYETYVFEDGKFPGDHNSFTQSEKLVNATGYEQWYVGASGPIASEQLQDYNSKIQGQNKQRVVMFRAPINEELAEGIDAKLEQARIAHDNNKIQKFEAVVEQRKNKYGVHWDNEGNSTIQVSEYPHLEFEFAA